jgi:MPBQ/MSBQ methyltransferase
MDPDASGDEMKETGMEAQVRMHLRTQYEGIFPPGSADRHYEEYVGLDFARELHAYVSDCHPMGGDTRLLDIGCGFGSFVLVCREGGVQAQGVDVADFDLEFARQRLADAYPADSAESVYRKMDAMRMDFDDATFDVVTLWNVVEHIPDASRVISEISRVLKPGGKCFLLAPNYFAFRREAHYQLPWIPLMPRSAARLYLKGMGRSPSFFDESIHYVTNRGIRRLFRRCGMEIDFESMPAVRKLGRIEHIRGAWKKRVAALAKKIGLLGAVRFGLAAVYGNPFKGSINLIAKKPDNR